MASTYQPLDFASPYHSIVSPYESIYTRFSAVPGLVLTTSLVIALVLGERYDHTFPSHFYNFVVANRSSTAFLVQILSHVLGALFVFALTSILNFRTRLTLARRSVSLFRLSWWNLLCNQRLDTHLPLQYGVLLFFWWAALIAPSALWAGALTPITTTTNVTSTVVIPKYTLDPNQLAWNQTGLYFQEGALNTTIIPDKGSFSYYPAYPVGGLILDTATDTGSSQTHAKHDRTRYSYSNRSYGVGSSIGLEGEVLNVNNLQKFDFTEHGYAADVECTINATSAWKIYVEEYSGLSGIPNDYVALGTLPNSGYVGGRNITSVDYGSLNYKDVFTWKPEGYPVLGFYSNTEIVGIAGLSNNSRNIFAIAAYGYGDGQQLVDSRYSFLNNTQCEVTFKPYQFALSVDTIQRVINVTKSNPLSPQDETLIVDPSTATYGTGLGILAQRAMRQVMTLAMINTSLYTSVIGDVFSASANNALDAQRAGTIDPSLSNTTVALIGVAQALESMLDDMLSGFASAQLMLTPPVAPTSQRPPGSTTIPCTAGVGAVKIGSSRYIYPLAAVNFALVLLLIVEAVLHKGWDGLHKFNYNDMKSVIVATSMAGTGIAEQVVMKNKQKGKRWTADRADDDVGTLRVQLVEDRDRGPTIMMVRSRLQGLETPLPMLPPETPTPYSTASSTMGGARTSYFGGVGVSTSGKGVGGYAQGEGESDTVPLVKLNTVRRKPLRGQSSGSLGGHLDTWGE